MEKARKAYVVFMSLQILWTALYFLGLLGILAALTVFLQWWRIPIFILLGLLTGFSVAALRERISSYFYIVLIVVPLFTITAALWLAWVGAGSANALLIYSRYLFAFLVFGLSSFMSILILARIWSRKFELKVVAAPADAEEMQQAAV